MTEIVKQSMLEPLSMGQLLDRGFRLYRKHFLQFLGIVALAQLPVMLLTIGSSFLNPATSGRFLERLEPSQLTPLVAAGSLVAVFVGVFGFIVTQISTAVVTQAVADDYMGKSLGIIEAYRKIGRSWVSLLGTLFLTGLLMFGLIVAFIIPCIGWALALPGLGGIMFFSAVVIPLVAPVVVLERLGGMNALARAWNLARRRFWWTFGFMLLLALLGQIIITGPTLLVTALLGGVGLASAPPVWAVVAQNAVSTLLSIIYLPLQLTCITLLYFDIRVRVEGFDMTLLAAEDGVDIAEFSKDLPESEKRLVFDGTEAGYFCAITVGLFLFVFGFGILFAGIIGALASSLAL